MFNWSYCKPIQYNFIHFVAIEMYTLCNSHFLHITCSAWLSIQRMRALHISSGTRQNDVNAYIVLPGTHRFAGNSLFCQVHAFEVWTPTSTYRQLSICMFYSSKFHTKQDFVFKYHILQFYLQFRLLMGSSNSGSFIVHTLLPGTSKAFILSVFLPGACVYVLLPGTQRYG